MKTYSAKPSEIEHRWFVVDAEAQTLGRLATVDRRQPQPFRIGVALDAERLALAVQQRRPFGVA